MKEPKGKHQRAMRRKDRLTLSQEIAEDGQVTLRGMTVASSDQAWFWGQEWQQGEREASAQIAAGHTEAHEDAESMFAVLGQKC